jgi:hypothetical protein
LSADGEAGGSEEELRAAYEAELSRISATDMMAQAAVSLLNIGARRLAPAGTGAGGEAAGQGQAPQRDLEQARDAIDAVRALLDILGRRIPQELAPLRDALSRLQMAYAQEVAPGAPDPQPAAGGPAGEPERAPDASAQERPPGPGPAESSGRLWVPGR